jgi:hypothetical protein
LLTTVHPFLPAAARIIDRSMLKKLDQHVEDVENIPETYKGAPLTNGDKDITDLKNEEFVYVY